MSDGFPSRASADAILSRGEVDEVGGRFPASDPAFYRGRTTVEVRARLTQESRALWTVTRVGQLIVVLGQDMGRSA